MPALLVDTTTTSTRPISPSHSSTSSSTTTEQRHRKRSESDSPDRPPVSPITPTVTAARLAALPPSEPSAPIVPPQHATTRTQPPSVPISDSENPDAIALRSAISLLQLQREKSKRDLKTLEDLKAAAVSDPQGFVRSIQAQRTQPSKANIDPLSPTLLDGSGSLLDSLSGAANEGRNGEGRKDSADVASAVDPSTKFAPLPQPQNIIRCPPVNWAKYHVVGESLDKMHKEQRQYPGSVEPQRNQQGTKAPPHAVSAPYSPFTDSVGDAQPAQPWRGPKKSPS